MSERLRMKIKGMTCDHCEGSVAEALKGAGATDASADFRREEAVFTVAGAIDESKLNAAIKDAGYRPGTIEVLEAEHPGSPEQGSAGDDGYDVAIIGSGSAAFAAAIRARDLGARVVMVEQGTLGGTCVNVGCVPSKALLRAAEVYHQAGHHTFAGIETRAGKVDLQALVGQKRDLVETLRREKYEELVPAYDWEVVEGHAEFLDSETVSAAGRTITATSFIVAAGASPTAPPIDGLEDAGYLTSTTALELEELPESLAVIGGNAIGLEMGQLFAHLGSKVTLIEVLDRVAPFEEPEVSDTIAGVLHGEGMEVLTSATIAQVRKAGKNKRLEVTVSSDTREITVSEILVATGRRPNTDGLGLDKAGVDVDKRGAIVVDETLSTRNGRVWAAGDVTPAPQFVYVAAHEGTVAAENAVNSGERQADLAVVPRVTFTTPPIASVGLTEEQAKEQGYHTKVSVLPGEALARAWVNRDTRRVFKLVADAETDQLLGVHVVADNAGDVIYSAVLALKFKLTVADLVDTLAPYLTMSEGLRLAAQTFDRDVAKLSCCAG